MKNICIKHWLCVVVGAVLIAAQIAYANPEEKEIKIPPWQPSLTLGLNGYLTSFSGMTSSSVGFSLGYWPWRMFEFGGEARVNVSKYSFDGGESTSTGNTFTSFFRIYYFPTKKSFKKWAEKKRWPNPFKTKCYSGLGVGVTTTGVKSTFDSFSSDTTETELTFRFEVLGIQWAVRRNMAVNFNVVTIDTSEEFEEPVLSNSISFRVMIPVGRKR